MVNLGHCPVPKPHHESTFSLQTVKLPGAQAHLFYHMLSTWSWCSQLVTYTHVLKISLFKMGFIDYLCIRKWKDTFWLSDAAFYALGLACLQAEPGAPIPQNSKWRFGRLVELALSARKSNSLRKWYSLWHCHCRIGVHCILLRFNIGFFQLSVEPYWKVTRIGELEYTW